MMGIGENAQLMRNYQAGNQTDGPELLIGASEMPAQQRDVACTSKAYIGFANVGASLHRLLSRQFNCRDNNDHLSRFSTPARAT